MRPLVSVVMIVYNHEKFIAEAIKGVFAQETNFDIEFIISNDCSKDNTDSIIRDLIKDVPNRIKIIYLSHPVNLGMNKNFVTALNKASGKYIALCEGDDFWLDSKKIQKQVDFLEKNDDYSIVCHNVFLLNEKMLESEYYDSFGNQPYYTIFDLAKRNFIPTLSVVYRNIAIDFPKWYFGAPMGDYPLMMWVAKTGKIKFFRERMGVYRENVGIWSGAPKEYDKIIETIENLIIDFKSSKEIVTNLKEHRNRYIKTYLLSLKTINLVISPNFLKLNIIDKIKVLIRKIGI